MAEKKINVYAGTGRRKMSSARVSIKPGKGVITINGKDVNDYFPFQTLVLDLKQPLALLDLDGKFDISAKVVGGGFSGQAGAVRLGLARALMAYDEAAGTNDSETSYRKALKTAGFITRDARIKERKKPGLKKARRAPQFSKR